MRRVLRTVTVAAVIGIPALLLPAGPAAAADTCASDHFCAYQNASYHGKILDSRAVSGARVDVADNQVTSARNIRNNRWDGINIRSGPLPDQTVFRFAAQTSVANVGPNANDKIDYFDVH